MQEFSQPLGDAVKRHAVNWGSHKTRLQTRSTSMCVQ